MFVQVFVEMDIKLLVNSVTMEIQTVMMGAILIVKFRPNVTKAACVEVGLNPLSMDLARLFVEMVSYRGFRNVMAIQ